MWEGLAPAWANSRGPFQPRGPVGSTDTLVTTSLLLPNLASFISSLVMLPRVLPRKPSTDMTPSQSLFCVDLNPAILFPNLESWGACYSFLGSPLPLQVFMSKQQWLGLLHTLFWEVSESYQHTKIFLQVLCRLWGKTEMTLPWPACPSSGRQEHVSVLPTWEGEALLRWPTGLKVLWGFTGKLWHGLFAQHFCLCS